MLSIIICQHVGNEKVRMTCGKEKMKGVFNMKHTCTVLSVADIKTAKKFYEDLFGLKLFQDYGKNGIFYLRIGIAAGF